jgi:hypothetical protein
MMMNTCETLFNWKCISHFNSARINSVDQLSRVSWATSTSGSSYSHAFGSLEQFLQWLSDGDYTCVLFDFSLIRASYNFEGNRIVGHSLLYWPFPLDPVDVSLVTEVSDACHSLEMCIRSSSEASELVRLCLRSPMRFDFDPGRAGAGHPEVHLHTQYEKTRMHVNRPMCFNAFMKLVFRTFYAEHWARHPQLQNLHEHSIDAINGGVAPEQHCLQVDWS